MHQRSCRVIHGLNDELLADLEEQSTKDSANTSVYSTAEDTDNMANNIENQSFPVLKKGINLPKSDADWLTANNYFKFTIQLSAPIRGQDLSSSITHLNNVVYNYFADNFGHVEKIPDKELVNKYKDQTVKDLKKSLKQLKLSNADPCEIKYVSRTLRDKLRNSSSNVNSVNNTITRDQSTPPKTFNHDNLIGKNFWGYVKNIMHKSNSLLPTFTMSSCVSYFKDTLNSINPNKLFHIPSWIPKLSDPTVHFDLEPPTYRQVTNIIRRMKASGSPCPLDQLSIICFKRCPFLRTYLTEVIRCVWSSKSVPAEWKKACSILIHKKGDTNDPSNFRPITLETVPLKVFTSCLRNSMFSFLKANNFIEHNIQKGFTPNLAGTLEHTAQMTNIINQARIKQRSVVITLIDLRNAFGEVHHNLIQSVLDYHHIPKHVSDIIKSLYTDFHTAVITSDFSTPFMHVGRGVLQGDCLSPLLFNMCFNTFIQHIRTDKYRQFGFITKFLNPIHWLQFADDAAVITSQSTENQHLLNRFSIWCQWSEMIIRVDKCSTFGIRKTLTKSVQYLPKLLINNKLIPTTEIGESFRYLGKYFDFGMSDKKHKEELITLLEDIMADIDLKPLHPKNKILLYSRYLLSKLSWHFTVASLSKTWVTENIDSVVNKYIRKWLEIPVSGTLSNVYLANNKFGLNIYPPSVKFAQCQTVARNALKTSPNASIKNLWKETSDSRNIQYDVYSTTKEVLKSFNSQQQIKLQNHLVVQGSFFSNVIKFSLKKLNSLWSKSQSNLPKNIYNFTIRYINNSLPTRRNLTKWGIMSNSDCSFCLKPETLLHVVAGCQSYLPRFTWRHDSVLNFIAKTLQPVSNSDLFVDLPGFKSPSVISSNTFRPDLLLSISNDHLYILELSVGFESNLQTNVDRKRERYKDLVVQQREHYRSVKFVNLSISSLGVFSKECDTFLDMLNDLCFDDRHRKYCIGKIMSIAIRATYYIFCCRNKDWPTPELLAI